MDIWRNIRVGQIGVSLVELVVTLTILSILAVLVLPSAQLISKRSKEVELRRNLRIIRTAIDDFKKTYDRGVEEKKIIQSLNKSGYPETLEQLVEGHDFGGLLKEKKKFLRRIPHDPFAPGKTGKDSEWGLRSYADKPDSSIWGGEDVFDVYSQSDATAIDGTKYKDW
jgi:general secretion pathway protein G